MLATVGNQRQRQWQLKPNAVSPLQSVVPGCCCIQQLAQYCMTRGVLPINWPLELFMWNRWPLMNANTLQIVSYEMQHVAKAFFEAPCWEIIHQQNVNLSGSHRQATQTLRSTIPVLLHIPICSQGPPGAKQSNLRLCKRILRCA
jgi:hypothetical protein